MAARTVSLGWTCTSGGSPPPAVGGRGLRLVGHHGLDRVAGAARRPQEPVVGHPAVVVHLRQVAPPRVGHDDHDHGVGAEVPAHLQGRPHRRPARTAGQDPLFSCHPAGGQEAVAVGHHHDPVGDVAVVGGRPEVLADPLDQVGPALAP